MNMILNSVDFGLGTKWMAYRKHQWRFISMRASHFFFASRYCPYLTPS